VGVGMGRGWRKGVGRWRWGRRVGRVGSREVGGGAGETAVVEVGEGDRELVPPLVVGVELGAWNSLRGHWSRMQVVLGRRRRRCDRPVLLLRCEVPLPAPGRDRIERRRGVRRLCGRWSRRRALRCVVLVVRSMIGRRVECESRIGSCLHRRLHRCPEPSQRRAGRRVES
jgi:hypothetical protein